ncbi:MAG TPA: respiratory nitrate reductase subunit gamma [Candidatus Acidoferrum sp.]|nr:respiratory nitrate reductase subunit gamma [Candidatus Acidoferrum sp.]
MPSLLPSANELLFVVLPYLVMTVFFLGTIMRYRMAPYTYSSLSSQFLENQEHFWALVPFHFGIITILTGHVLAFLIPRQTLLWNSRPLRLYVLEVAALAFGLLALVGILAAIHRRLSFSKIREVTTPLDWIVFALLFIQVLSGVLVATLHPWGSSWFAAILTPYLWSLVTFTPDITYILGLPLLIKTHILLAYVLIGLSPFTRLVHILVAPNPYLWRRPQIVRWYRRPGASVAERRI